MFDAELYYARTGNSLRAVIAVELAGIEVRKHELNLPGMEHKQDWFIKLNPAGAVPVLVERDGDDTMVLTQSGAIMAHLVDRHRPDLWPQAPADKSLCMASFIAALSDVAVQNSLARWYLESMPDASRFVFGRLTDSILAAFATVKNQPFLCGQSKTIADYAHLPVIYMREHALAAMPEFKHVSAWLARMQDDPAVARAVAYAGLQLKA
ncbi:MAG: glutathione S-transferase family protein [Gammaproteobacteria bacterium]|nr:glutathione S-transferase family protein [Gammaproteobacteria bacterium]